MIASFNPVAIEGYLRLVLLQWMVIIAVAWACGRLGQKLGQPRAVGEIAGGILLGPSGLGMFWPGAVAWLFPPETHDTMQVLAKIGLILLMFQVGMEFDFGHLRARSWSVTAISLTGLVAPMAGGLLIGPWLHRTFAPEVDRLGFQLFVCIALSISALPILGRILLELKLEHSPLGVLAVSAAAIDDVVGWMLLAAASAIVTTGLSWWAVAYQAVGLSVLFAVLMLLVGPLKRKLWRYLNPDASEAVLTQNYLTLVLLALLASCLATNRLGLFSIFGAFLLGVALQKEVSLVAVWREKYLDLVLVAFVPVFFTNTGLRTDIGSLSSGMGWVGCGVILATAVAGKLGGCGLGARLTGQSWRIAGCVGALLNTRALMGLVAIHVGLELKLLNSELFTMFVIMALVTTVMTGPLLHFWLPPELRYVGRRARARSGKP